MRTTPEQAGRLAYKRTKLAYIAQAMDAAYEVFIQAKSDYLKAKKRYHAARMALMDANSPEVKIDADAAGRGAAANAYKEACEREGAS